MTEYEMIENYLQEAVNNDIYTEEFTNEVLELAYDKYVMEANAYNKAIKKCGLLVIKQMDIII